MKESTYSWLWFIPMLLPFLRALQLEADEPAMFNSNHRSGKVTSALGFWSSWIVGFIGVYLMIESAQPWYWFIPFLIPVLLLLPQKMKEWELDDEEKKHRKALRKASQKNKGISSLIWKLIKIALGVGILWLFWVVGGYYLLDWVLGSIAG
jgi:hypothetical protein